MKSFFATIITVLFSIPAFGAIDIGVGMSSTTSGRFVPALTSTFLMTDWAVSGSANGVQSGYYYHSIYTLNYYRTWASGELFGGNVTSGFGGGLSYSVRGFKEDSSLEEASDFTIGPAFFVRWDINQTVFVNTEMIWGVRDFFSHVALNAQDVIVFSVGAQLW